MERLEALPDIESRLWAVLTSEHLVDLSQFHRTRIFDEVPLFSRLSQIEFLEELTQDRANRILIGFALKFLKSVVSYEEHRSSYFAAVTLWEAPETDRVVPNLFVWSRPARDLRKALTLVPVATSFGKKIRSYVSQGPSRDGYQLLEDSRADPEESRVFISLAHRPYKNFVLLSALRAPARPAT